MKLTFSHLKMDGSKTTFLLEPSLFSAMFVLGRVIYKTMSDSDVAKLTSVIKLEHFNCSNHIKELAFLSLAILLLLAFFRGSENRDPER